MRIEDVMLNAEIQQLHSECDQEKHRKTRLFLARKQLPINLTKDTICDAHFSDGRKQVVFVKLALHDANDTIDICVRHKLSSGKWDTHIDRYDFDQYKDVFVPTEKRLPYNAGWKYDQNEVDEIKKRYQVKIDYLSKKLLEFVPEELKGISLKSIMGEIIKSEKPSDATRILCSLKQIKCKSAADIYVVGISNIDRIGKKSRRIVEKAISNLGGSL